MVFLCVATTVLGGGAIVLFILGSHAKDATPEFTLAGGVLIVFLILCLATLARGQQQPIQSLYFAAIGTLIGAILGIAGGAVVGNQAGQSAAQTVQQQSGNAQSSGPAAPAGGNR